MTVSTTDIYWVSGILEGEGCFTLRNSTGACRKIPVISVPMTDKDVMDRVAKITNSKCYGPYKRPGKDMYRIDMVAFKAVQWMMTVYTVMGHRRKGRILEILEYWKNTPKRGHHQSRKKCQTTGRFVGS